MTPRKPPKPIRFSLKESVKILGLTEAEILSRTKTLRSRQKWQQTGVPGKDFVVLLRGVMSAENHITDSEARRRMDRMLLQLGKLIYENARDELRIVHILLNGLVGDVTEAQEVEIRRWLETIRRPEEARHAGARLELS